MLAPSVALLVLFFVVPVGVAAVESAFAWDMLTPPRFVGAENYEALARGGELLRVALRTFAFSALVVVGAMAIGLGLAVLFNRRGRLYAFARGAVFSAYVVSWVAVALLWTWMLDSDSGVIAAALHACGLPRVGFLTDPRVALVTLAGVAVWKIAGYAMIVFLAGLQSVPPDLLEAAALDGARPWARFRWIVWPLLRPTAAFVATTSLVISFQAFDVVRIMTQGGPANATELFVYAIYEQIFLNLRVGRASALTVVFLLLLLFLTGLQLRAWRQRTAA